jgi:hypothetical protein
MAVRQFRAAHLLAARTPDDAAVSGRTATASPVDPAASGWRGDDRRAAADRALADGLAGYVRAVASAVNVSAEATASEVSDTATAYLALSVRSTAHPGHDLMLVWTERHGWALSVETAPTEPPAVLAYFGPDVVPAPSEVAGFVTGVLAGSSRPGRVPSRMVASRREVGTRLARYAQPRS